MKVGVNEAAELKALSERLGLPFANLLWGYALEDLLLRIYSSAYREHLWLRSDRMLGEKAYRRGVETGPAFFYVESRRLPAPEKLVPGQTLTPALAEQMLREIFQIENRQGIHWEGRALGEPGAVTLDMTACYMGMHVPMAAELRTLADSGQRPETRRFSTVAAAGKELTYLIYASESQVSHDLFEMMEKLELIGDMGAYYRVYQAFLSRPLSGRYLMEELTALAEEKPKVKTEKRMEQLAGYRDYAYMRRRWEQYVKRRQDVTPWEDAVHLILTAVEPIWVSLCREEVFLGDWMPELGRYI